MGLFESLDCQKLDKLPHGYLDIDVNYENLDKVDCFYILSKKKLLNNPENRFLSNWVQAHSQPCARYIEKLF